MIDASRSIKACAAFYDDEADAMEAYLKAGEKRALELDNRGPISFGEDGKLCPSIREAYSKYGFYVFIMLKHLLHNLVLLIPSTVNGS